MIDRNAAGAGFENGEIADDELTGQVEKEADGASTSDPTILQRNSKGVRQPVQLFERQCAAIARDGVSRGRSGSLLSKQFVQRRVGEHDHIFLMSLKVGQGDRRSDEGNA